MKWLDSVTEMLRKRRVVGRSEMVFRVFPALGFLDPPDKNKVLGTEINQHQQARKNKPCVPPEPGEVGRGMKTGLGSTLHAGATL